MTADRLLSPPMLSNTKDSEHQNVTIYWYDDISWWYIKEIGTAIYLMLYYTGIRLLLSSKEIIVLKSHFTHWSLSVCLSLSLLLHCYSISHYPFWKWEAILFTHIFPAWKHCFTHLHDNPLYCVSTSSRFVDATPFPAYTEDWDTCQRVHWIKIKYSTLQKKHYRAD